MTIYHRVNSTRTWMLALLLGAVLAMLAIPTVAFATPDEIGGCDHVLAGQESLGDGAINILTVSGNDGETIYIEVKQSDGTVIASHLAYVLHDDDGTVDEDGKVIGVVSVTPATGVSLDGATVRVYGDRTQSQSVWEGTIRTAYARLGDQGRTTEVPLAMRTLADGEERPFAAPGSLRHGDVVYALTGDAPTTEDDRIVYAYEVSSDTPASVDGHISYYDSKDPSKPIRVDTVAGIGRDTSREADIPDIILVDGHAYRTIQLSNRITLSYPGATEYSVQCLELEAGPWEEQDGFYKARIDYVDADGRSLGITDSVIVDRRYLYTPPTRLHIRGDDVLFATYALSSGNDLSDGGAIVLEPGQAEGVRTVGVVYEPVADDAERTWTVVLVNGSVSPSDPAREIRRVTYRGKPGESVTHRIDASVDVDGTTLVPSSFSEDTYRHTFGTGEDQIDQVIYYVPDGWAEPDAYEVKVNYVNIATNGVISSETYTASPAMRRDLEIDTPQTFMKGDAEYIRLNGQNLSIRHSFYSPNRTYNIYYRESGDDLHTKTIVRSVRIEYVDPETGDTVYRPTTFAPSAGASTGNAGGSSDMGSGARRTTAPQTARSNGSPAGNGTNTGNVTNGGNAWRPADGTATATVPGSRRPDTSTGIGTDADIATIIDDGTPVGIVTPDGSDLATIRIKDNEIPLASDSGDGSTANPTDAPDGRPMLVGLAVGMVTLIGLVALAGILIARHDRTGYDLPGSMTAQRHREGRR